MSAINVLVQREAAYMATDGLTYLAGVPLDVDLNKTIVIRGMRAALSATGPACLGGYIAEHVEREFQTFDELIAHGTERIKALFHEHVHTYRNGDAVSTLMVVGWHEHEDRPAAYGIDMETDGDKAEWVKANSPHPPGFGESLDLKEFPAASVPCPTRELFLEAGYDLASDINEIYAEADLLHLLEIQRRMTIQGVSYVGGEVTLTTVMSRGVTQRVIHTWPEDRVGETVRPLPVDWSSYRR